MGTGTLAAAAAKVPWSSGRAARFRGPCWPFRWAAMALYLALVAAWAVVSAYTARGGLRGWTGVSRTNLGSTGWLTATRAAMRSGASASGHWGLGAMGYEVTLCRMPQLGEAAPAAW